MSQNDFVNGLFHAKKEGKKRTKLQLMRELDESFSVGNKILGILVFMTVAIDNNTISNQCI